MSCHVDDGVGLKRPKGCRDGTAVGECCLHEVHLGRYRVAMAFREVVDHEHGMPTVHEYFRDDAADVAGAPGDGDSHGYAPSLGRAADADGSKMAPCRPRRRMYASSTRAATSADAHCCV